jgi:glycosyltransferase involved in cell wall biosynthesis
MTEEGQIIPLNDQISYFGYAGVEDRCRLMSEAHAVLMPTQFMEPFGGVAVETQFCGTPIITTDHAAFSETVKHGVTGYRCHTLEQFKWAVENTDKLCSPEERRRIAITNYGIDKVRYMYEEWFHMLLSLRDGGWPNVSDMSRTDMSWLCKC